MLIKAVHDYIHLINMSLNLESNFLYEVYIHCIHKHTTYNIFTYLFQYTHFITTKYDSQNLDLLITVLAW